MPGCKINLTLGYTQCNFDTISIAMGEIAGEWLFAVGIWIIVLILFISLVKELWKRRHKPDNPHDKEIGRMLIKDLIKFMFGGGKKYKEDNPMYPDEKDNDFI
jgi:hypothetical protein